MTWKFLTLGFAPVLFLSGCDLPPQGTSTEDVANYIAAVDSIGCDVVDEGDYQALEIQTGLPQEQLVAMGEYLFNTQQALRLTNGGLRSVAGGCAPSDASETPTEPAQG